MGQPGPSGLRDETVMMPNLIKINVIKSGPNGPEKTPLGKICPLCNVQCRYYLLTRRFKVEACESAGCNFPYRTGELNLIREEFYFDEQKIRRPLPARVMSEQEIRKLAIAGVKEIYRSKVLLRRRLVRRKNKRNKMAGG